MAELFTGLDAGTVRANLDRALARDRRLTGPCQRAVEIGCLDDPEAAEVFFGFGERAVGHEELAVTHLHNGRTRRFVQPTAEHPTAVVAEFLVEGLDVSVHVLHLLRGWRFGTVDVVNRQEILLHGVTLSIR